MSEEMVLNIVERPSGRGGILNATGSRWFVNHGVERIAFRIAPFPDPRYCCLVPDEHGVKINHRGVNAAASVTVPADARPGPIILTPLRDTLVGGYAEDSPSVPTRSVSTRSIDKGAL